MRSALLVSTVLVVATPGVAASQLDRSACVGVKDATADCIPVLIGAAGEAFQRRDHATVETVSRQIIAISNAASSKPTLETGQAHNLLGTAIEDRDLTAALTEYRRAVAVYDTLPELVDDKRIALHNLGYALLRARSLDDAEAAFRQAVSIAQALNERSGEYAARHGLGTALYRAARNHEADEELRHALGIAIELWGDARVETGQTYRALGLNLAAQSRYADAETMLRRALAIFRAKDGETHRRVALVYGDIAEMLLAQGKFGDAAEAYRKALALQTELLGAGHAETVSLAFQLGQTTWELGDREGGLRVMGAALSASVKVSDPDDTGLAGLKKLYAMFLHRSDRHAEDEQLRRESLATYMRRLPPTDGRVIGAMAEFGTVLLYHDKPAEALAYHRLAAARLTRRLEDSSRSSVLLNERNRKRTYYRTLVATLWYVSP